LIDEVLAVGDVAFQKKSLGKMEDVSQQGRTVIFVSHNINALQRLCPNSILLNHGHLVTQASTNEVVEQYLSTSSTTSTTPNIPIELRDQNREGTKKVRFESLVYKADNPSLAFHPYTNGPLDVWIDLFAEADCSIGSVALIIFDRYGTKLVNADTLSLGRSLDLTKGINTINFKIDQLHLNPGLYTIGLWAADPPVEVYDYLKSAALFEVVETEDDKIRVYSDGVVSVNFQITKLGIEEH
jgi:ABC-type glutathione transport system ATPase component